MKEAKDLWNKVFSAADAVNTAPPEAVIRMISYHLRSHFKPEEYNKLHFLDVGCGAGATIIWLVRKGVRVSGVDISSRALDLCRYTIDRRVNMDEYKRVIALYEGSIANKTFWESETFDGITTSNVLQHLDREGREGAFTEIKRLLRPSGCLVSYEMSTSHTAYLENTEWSKSKQVLDDPGTIICEKDSPFGDVGLTHFFTWVEWAQYLEGFSLVDPCQVMYEIPEEEAERRNCGRIWAFFCVYAVK